MVHSTGTLNITMIMFLASALDANESSSVVDPDDPADVEIDEDKIKSVASREGVMTPTVFLIDLSGPQYLQGRNEEDLKRLLNSEEHWTYELKGKNDSKCMLSGYLFGQGEEEQYVSIEHYELDPAALEDLIQVQIQSCIDETSSIDKLSLIFWMVINSCNCPAVDEEGEPCMGWTKKWQDRHQSYSIPDKVKDILVKLSSAKELETVSCIPTCA
ncbi:hypothetical protein GYMLUDRAFT_55547 [Collybiopsis luxurians FD-317 M1]|nr:hypothetical protein GYMLUDRAFT_55547 [Collybiopsis luxurians FD-317 M1]